MRWELSQSSSMRSCRLWVEECWVSPPRDLQTFPHSSQIQGPPEAAAMVGRREVGRAKNYKSEDEERDMLNVMPELVSLVLTMLFRDIHPRYVPPIGLRPITVSFRQNYSHCLLDGD